MVDNKTTGFINSFVILGICLAMIGCKATPHKELTEYLGDTSEMVKLEEIPFNQIWYDDTVDWDGFKKLYLAPVNTAYLRKQSWWDKTNFSGNREKAVNETAQYLYDAVKKAFQQDPKGVLLIVDEPDSEMLVLELALTELVPTKAWLNTVSYAGIFMAIDSGTVAIEGKVREGLNGDIVCKFADRQMGKQSLASAADLTWNSHARHIMDDWSKQLVDIANVEEGEAVGASSAFTLKPW